MIEWIQANIQNILIAIGAAVVLFLPQIKAKIAELQAPSSPPAPENDSQPHRCCCPHCVADVLEAAPEQKRSDWVVSVMEVRQYCESKRLTEGVELCDQLVGVIVKGNERSKTVVVAREV